MHTNPLVLGRGHEHTNLCRQGAVKVRAHAAAAEARRALTHHFMVNREPLKRVEAFKYLGWLMSIDDVDRQAINTNL